MAVKLESTIKRYIGLSTDTKPRVGVAFDGYVVLANDLPAGSSFLESDTGRIYRWDGSDWAYASADGSEEARHEEMISMMSAVCLELRLLRERVELVTA